MSRRSISVVFLRNILLLLLISPWVQAATYQYSFSNAGYNHQVIDPIVGAVSDSDYYNYGVSIYDGAPAFGTEPGKAFVWLYEDSTTNNLSLGFIFNSDNHRQGVGGSVSGTFSGIPSGAGWTVYDDVPSEIGNWNWVSTHTDGGMLGGLKDAAWDISFTDVSFSGISDWYMLGGAGKYDYKLDMSKGLTVHTSAIPIPSAFILFASTLIAFVTVSRRRLI